MRTITRCAAIAAFSIITSAVATFSAQAHFVIDSNPGGASLNLANINNRIACRGQAAEGATSPR